MPQRPAQADSAALFHIVQRSRHQPGHDGARPLDRKRHIAGLRGRRSDADRGLSFSVNGQLGELAGEILKPGLVLGIQKFKAERLDVMGIHFIGDFDNFHRHGDVGIR